MPMSADHPGVGRRRAVYLLPVIFAFGLLVAPISPAGAASAIAKGEQRAGSLSSIIAVPGTGRSTQVGSDPAPGKASPATATINVTYSGFSVPAQQAFQAAVDIWEATINSSVTINIQANWTNLGTTGILGSAGPTTISRNFTGGVTNRWYPAALANTIAGSDLNGATSEITASFNNQFPNWYLGTTGPTPAGQYDLESVVLHEIGHGLGVIDSFRISGGQVIFGSSGSPYIQDNFIVNGSNTLLTSFPSGTPALTAQATSNDVFWNGAQATANNGGNKPKLYAPNPWQQGSSIAHLDESTYPAGDVNSLMTPQIGSGERIVAPGPIIKGYLVDIGWTVSPK